MIVDDNVPFLDAAATLLERQGVSITGVATSTAQAVDIVHRLQPDVVLIDISLGADSGFDLARRLAAWPAQAALVLVSTHDPADYADLIDAAPVMGFVPKSELSAAAIERLVGTPES
ncbi:MAG TPA: response regulator [Jatrophihabitans sp.]|nr:response regulator [Jatrophihabitans sp.]